MIGVVLWLVLCTLHLLAKHWMGWLWVILHVWSVSDTSNHWGYVGQVVERVSICSCPWHKRHNDSSTTKRLGLYTIWAAVIFVSETITRHSDCSISAFFFLCQAQTHTLSIIALIRCNHTTTWKFWKCPTQLSMAMRPTFTSCPCFTATRIPCSVSAGRQKWRQLRRNGPWWGCSEKSWQKSMLNTNACLR